jgi:hypothetical protein
MATTNLRKIAATTAIVGALSGAALGLGAGIASADDDGAGGTSQPWNSSDGLQTLLPLGDLANGAGGDGLGGNGQWQDFAGGGQWQDFVGNVPWGKILSAFG